MGSEPSAWIRMYATRLPKLRSVTLSTGTVDCQIPVVNLCLVLFFDVAAVPFLYFIWSGLSVRWKHTMDTILNWPPQRHSAVLGSLAYVTGHSQLVCANYLLVKQSLFGWPDILVQKLKEIYPRLMIVSLWSKRAIMNSVKMLVLLNTTWIRAYSSILTSRTVANDFFLPL